MNDYHYDYKQFNKGDYNYDYTKWEKDDYDYNYDYSAITVSRLWKYITYQDYDYNHDYTYSVVITIMIRTAEEAIIIKTNWLK